MSAKTVKVKGINLKSGFWWILQVDTSTKKVVLRNKRDQTMILPLWVIEDKELIEKRIKLYGGKSI